MSSYPEISTTESFIERVGLSIESDGLPRIAGRMLGFMVLNGGPLSFSELAEQLQVSRASVCTNARILSSLGVIERVSRPGDRQDYYQLAESPYARLISGYLERKRQMYVIVQDALRALSSDDDPARRQRLEEMASFYRVAIAHLQRLVEEMGASDAGKEVAPGAP
ncbi:hypothetical protein BI364_00415 [Acidihalobacter yilgarnensis]|uniref:HTH arsR-type domain-containing protein n=1 Tax=Acidihalobacter yilgarnensis TaxID=2819280 RepID=A0A1D8IJR7_9GAMM|nr:MarR family transcriptional regulator [Acidihalobacter yilgarnensis]AOU96686.1 hypothetical protein BI364_00415 [Acidihalobacter yilgarnensis]